GGRGVFCGGTRKAGEIHSGRLAVSRDAALEEAAHRLLALELLQAEHGGHLGEAFIENRRVAGLHEVAPPAMAHLVGQKEKGKGVVRQDAGREQVHSLFARAAQPTGLFGWDLDECIPVRGISAEELLLVAEKLRTLLQIQAGLRLASSKQVNPEGNAVNARCAVEVIRRGE